MLVLVLLAGCGTGPELRPLPEDIGAECETDAECSDSLFCLGADAIDPYWAQDYGDRCQLPCTSELIDDPPPHTCAAWAGTCGCVLEGGVGFCKHRRCR